MGVIVLGMHRSGTSAVTRVIDLLGVPIGSPLMPARPDNPAGFWEVEPLAALNDELLERMDGSWDAPPRPEAGWESDDALAEVRRAAAAAFAAAHPGPTWVWKDPRACVLLAFWRLVLGDGHAAVVVLRDPAAIAGSLARRNALAPEVALAAWERSMRGVLTDAVGMPALVLRYDDLLDRPDSTLAELRSFLAAHAGSRPDVEEIGAARSSLRSDLRHHEPAAGRSGPSPSDEHRQRALPRLPAPVEPPAPPGRWRRLVRRRARG